MMDELLKRIERLEYYQQLLLEIVNTNDYPFTKLIIQKKLGPEEVLEFQHLCEYMNNKLQEQKAEGLLYFYPLLKEFSDKLNRKLEVKETVESCLQQYLYVELMTEFKKCLLG
ncbi:MULTISPECIES: DUF1878 family protein [Bacillaceae]|jgi:hypothetical protein|uniref:DUF1878 domain-containing protein n=1 Tax=Caldibacillus thermoamylovorans TaxID=35841 RepID=A0A090IZP4_9BACI|nr:MULTISPECIES: DUF1878 family protein [Bacillaceae]MBU5341817.1 YhaI family protein [Caldifermentibacillus hisashii]MED4850659.1 DUF1878 family protein [Caldifermentibacillus hisashii]CEE01020.1 hypothetical protein BT1A1_1188 [Caldibacillus thermoamylovorans]